MTASWSATPGRADGTGRQSTWSRSTSIKSPATTRPPAELVNLASRSTRRSPRPSCGGKTLAVDAVLIIGEHGDYPRNDKGQILYPRYEFFREAARVMEQDGRAVPVFNDKHLSFSFTWAREMVDTARRLKFPFLAGSSLPVTWRLPPIELPRGCVIDEALMVGVGSSDAMDFHALEAMQCMLERRRGGETGVKRVQLLVDDAVWRAGREGRWSTELLRSALSRSDSLQGLTVVDGRTQDLAASDTLRRLARHPAAYLIDYADGTHASMLMLDGVVADFTFAARAWLATVAIRTVSAAPQSQRRLFGLPDAQGRGNDQNRHGTLPGRADAACQWNSGKLPRLEKPGRTTTGYTSSRRSLRPTGHVSVLPDLTGMNYANPSEAYAERPLRCLSETVLPGFISSRFDSDGR